MNTESEINAKLEKKEAQFDVLLQELQVLTEKSVALDGDKFNAETLSNLGTIVTTAVKAGVLGNECGLLRNILKANAKKEAAAAKTTTARVTPKLHSMFHNG